MEIGKFVELNDKKQINNFDNRAQQYDYNIICGSFPKFLN